MLHLWSIFISGSTSKTWEGLIRFVDLAQRNLSRITMERLREAYTIDDLAKKMLSPKYTLEYTFKKGFPPKFFGCLYFCHKAVLKILRNEQVLICLKQVVARGVGQILFLQSAKSGEEFQLIPPPENPEEGVVVFEAVFDGGIEKLIEDTGFSNLILKEGAKCPPYYPTSTLEDIQDDEALNEVQSFRKKIDNRFELDHVVYCSLKEITEPLCKNY